MENKANRLSGKSSRQDFLKHLKTLEKELDNVDEKEFRRCLDSMSNFYNYSFHNCLLIRSQLPTAIQVASFKKWKKLGRTVKRGQHALWVLAPTKFKIEVKSEEEEDPDTREGISFHQVPVFDASQTEGGKAENALTTDSPLAFEEIKDFVLSIAPELKIQYQSFEISCGGEYCRDNLTISLNSNLDETQHTGTLLHELSHHLLGHLSENDKLDSVQKEQEAETLTYLFCKRLKIQRKSVFYLNFWNGIAKNTERIYTIFYNTLKQHERSFSHV